MKQPPSPAAAAAWRVNLFAGIAAIIMGLLFIAGTIWIDGYLTRSGGIFYGPQVFVALYELGGKNFVVGAMALISLGAIGLGLALIHEALQLRKAHLTNRDS